MVSKLRSLNEAQTLRFVSSPSVARSKAVIRAAKVSLTRSVRPSAEIAMPLGLTRSSAATETAPPGSTRSRTVDAIRSSVSSSQPKFPM